MAGLDDARVNRSHGYFMHPFAIDADERISVNVTSARQTMMSIEILA